MRFLFSISLFAALALAINVPTAIDQNDGLVKRELHEKRHSRPVHNANGAVIAGITPEYFLQEPTRGGWTTVMFVRDGGLHFIRRRRAARAIQNAKQHVGISIEGLFEYAFNGILRKNLRGIFAKKVGNSIDVKCVGGWWTGLFRNGEWIRSWEPERRSTFQVQGSSNDVIVMTNGEFFQEHLTVLKEAMKKFETEGSGRALDQLVGYLSNSMWEKLSSGQKPVMSAVRL